MRGTSSVDSRAGGAHRAGDHTQDAMAKLFGRDSLYMVLWAVQLIAAAGLTPLISRLMDSRAFGQVSVATAVMQILVVIGGLGLQQAVQRQYAEQGGPADARRLLGFAIVGAVVITVVAYLTGPMWAPALGFGFGGTLQLAVIWAGVSAVTATLLALLRSQDRLAVFASVSLMDSVVAQLASVLLIAYVAPTAKAFIAGQLLAQVAATGVGLLRLWPLRLRRRDWHLVRRALAYSLPLVPASLSTFVLGAADRLIISRELGSVQVARYQISYNLGAMPMLLLSVLSSAWMPRLFALGDGAHREQVLAASQAALYRLLGPVLLGLAIGAPILLRLWAPPSYGATELDLVTTIVIVTAVPFTAGLGSTRRLLISGRTTSVAVATIVAAVVNVGLNLLLVPAFGLRGSAASTLLAYALLYACLELAARRSSPAVGAGRTIHTELAVAVTIALFATLAPVSLAFLVVRGVLVVPVVLWFGLQLLRLQRGTRST